MAALSHPAPSAPPAAPPPFTRVLGKAPDAGRTQNAAADGRGRGAPNRPSGRSGATPAPRALSAAPVSGAASLPPPPPASELAGAHNTEPPPRNQSRRYCDPPANGLGKPAGLSAGDWTTADWQNHSTIDIRKLDSLATTAAVVATAKVRPTDSSMTSARVGDVRALDVSVTPAVWAPGSWGEGRFSIRFGAVFYLIPYHAVLRLYHDVSRFTRHCDTCITLYHACIITVSYLMTGGDS